MPFGQAEKRHKPSVEQALADEDVFSEASTEQRMIQFPTTLHDNPLTKVQVPL